ncbi:SH3 domain-containing protein [Aurantimonas sp. VKM B-3413]|uniref:SH3 domain-containing protein n=1 Tax=Aurantimonas sp. VKM B-3413 TaxID=2779401 RepID=UPI001E60D08E|nr:SH3 domain-containing protein [Aurantimonas sp. VKM B-3413]MCB8838685.1 SH3 domain-containing protein [Aurantimonas sp. VKM B-3413]
MRILRLLAVILTIFGLCGPVHAQAYAQDWQASIERWLYGLESRTATAECVAKLNSRAITFLGIAEDEPRISSGRRRDLNSMIAAAIPDKYSPRIAQAYREMVEGILPQRAASVAAAQALKDFYGSDMFLTVEPERRQPEILRLYLGLTILDPASGRICATETGPTLTLDLKRLGVAELSDRASTTEFYDVDGALREATVKALSRLTQHRLLDDPSKPLAYRVRSAVDAPGCELAAEINDTFDSAYTELSGGRHQRINESIGATSWPLLLRLPEGAAAKPPVEGVYLDITVAPASGADAATDEDGKADAPAVLKLDVAVQHSNGTSIGRYSYRVVVPRDDVRNCLPAARETAAAKTGQAPDAEPETPAPKAAGEACRTAFEAAAANPAPSSLAAFVAGHPECGEAVVEATRRLDAVAGKCLDQSEIVAAVSLEGGSAMLKACLGDFSTSPRHATVLQAALGRLEQRRREENAAAERKRSEETYKQKLAEAEARLTAERRQREEAERRAAELAKAREAEARRIESRQAQSYQRPAQPTYDEPAAPPPSRPNLPRCVVADPTGTPLNLRSSPRGAKVGELRNGAVVVITEEGSDSQGKAWARVAQDRSGRSPLGWVFRSYIRC